MAWKDSTFGTLDTNGIASELRIDREQTSVIERATLQLNTDTDAADTTSEGGGFVVPLRRVRTITTYEYVGLTKTFATERQTTLTADTSFDNATFRARRMNDADGWGIDVESNTYTNWIVGN